MSISGGPTTITLDPSSATIYEGAYAQFHTNGHYTGGIVSPMPYPWDITHYTSSDTSVAAFHDTFTISGRAYGIAAGTCTITAHLSDAYIAGGYTSPTAELTVVAAPAYAAPEARFSLAFGAALLDPYPTWTSIDTHANLVTSITVDRGRSYELDQTNAGTATVTIIDPDGILDPTNPDGPYYGQIRPMLQALICRRNPVTGTWEDRYRGFVQDYTYTVDPSQLVNQLTISLIDMFDLLSAGEMQVGAFGTDVNNQIRYANQDTEARIAQILTEAGIPAPLQAVFGGNTRVQTTTYSTGETPLSAIQEAADAELPGVVNPYVDRHGRFSFHGRQGRFSPDYEGTLHADHWDYHAWKAGDSAAVTASVSDTAQVRALGYQRGMSKIINSALALPAVASDTLASDPHMQVVDSASVAAYGVRSWSVSNLLTIAGFDIHGEFVPAPTETRLFARFYVQNYAQPKDRINQITFRSLDPADPRAAANWALLTQIDIADTIQITVATPGGGGFSSEGYFVEGIHEDAKPLVPGYDDVTLTLDLSPQSYYANNPWAAPDPDPIDNPAGASEVNPSMRSGGGRGFGLPLLHGLHTHARDHQYGSADPFQMHYEKVGLPAGGGTGGGGGILFDTDNEGGWLYVQANDQSEAGGSIHGYAIDLEDHSDSGSGIRIKSFTDVLSEANDSQTVLAHNGDVLIETDVDSTSALPAATYSLTLTAPNSGISLQCGGYLDLRSTPSDAGVLLQPDGTVSITGDLEHGGTATFASDTTFNAGTTFNATSVFEHFVQFMDACEFAATVGFDGDTAFTAKVGFYGNTPVSQPAHPTTLADVISALVALGLVAP